MKIDFTYTLVYYCPSGCTTSRGCVVDEWGPVFDYLTSKSRDAIIEKIISIKLLDYQMLENRNPEYYILLNGYFKDDIYHDTFLKQDEFEHYLATWDEMEKEIEDSFQKKVKELEEKEKQREIERQKEKEKQEREDKLRRFEKLKAELGL